MPNKTLRVMRLERGGEGLVTEALNFHSGVNVIAGPPNSGKTKWLSLLDFVFGDSDTPENALGGRIAGKYEYASAAVEIDGNEHVFERRWRQKGLRTKTLVNGQPMDEQEFSTFVLDSLGIPPIVFPRGDPANVRAWGALSWRMLLRHVYRQERFWNDIADQQPEREQHACLMTFLGVGTRLFPPEFSALYQRRNRVAMLQARRDQFMEILQGVTSEITDFEEAGVALTPEAIEHARARLNAERVSLEEERNGVLQQLNRRAAGAGLGRERYEGYAHQLAEGRIHLGKLRDEVSTQDKRAADLQSHIDSVRMEMERWGRARAAGEVLADLRVTHCPVCDRSVSEKDVEGDACYLCHRPIPPSGERERIDARVGFEMDQLREEERELSGLLEGLTRDRARLSQEMRRTSARVDELERLIQPAQTVAATVLPPDLALIDRRLGAVAEQIKTLDRVDEMLKTRETTAQEIDAIAREMAALDDEVERLGADIPFPSLGDEVADGFNEYLNALGPQRWPAGAVSVELRRRAFRVRVRGEDWAPALGATLRCYFLSAYHFALARLTERNGYMYPGLVVLDFPPTLTDGTQLRGHEDYLVEPFTRLTRERPEIQVIAAGQGFSDVIEGTHRIQLTNVWVSSATGRQIEPGNDERER